MDINWLQELSFPGMVYSLILLCVFIFGPLCAQEEIPAEHYLIAIIMVALFIVCLMKFIS